MIHVQVEIGFSFKHELPEDYRRLALPEETDLAGALRALAGRFPEIAKRIYTGDGEMRRDVGLWVNGTSAARRAGLRTILADGDRLTLLPPVGGG